MKVTMERNHLQDKVKEQHLKIQQLESEIQGCINEIQSYQNNLSGFLHIEERLRGAIIDQFESIKLRLIKTQ